MYCHDCGTANTVDSKYCKECGTKINDGYRTMMLSVQDLPVNQSDETLDKLTRLLDMAFWHNEAGNRDAAITAAEAALAINPNSTTAHSLLGTLYEKRGDDARAIEHFEAVLLLNPDSAADAAKLDQLRRGVHVKAVTPPAAHVWLPPGLVRLSPGVIRTWAVMTTGANRGAGAIPRRPLYVAGAATLLVLVSGLFLFRPWASAATISTPSPKASVVTAPGPVSVTRSAFAGGEQPAAISPPMILTASPNAAATTYYAPPAAPPLTGHDPFDGGRIYPPPVSRVAAAGVWSLPTVPRLSAAARRRLARRDLPALRLTALPAVGSSGELAPAPVFVPDGVALATVASIPQHTVVVNSLGQAPSADSYSPAPSGAHIRITVREAKSSDAEKAAQDAGNGGGDDSVKPDVYQQRALSLQQGGEYGQARAAYQRAIRAYAGQIASGRDVDTAQRGLAACQTGLQICQQSQ